MTTPHPKVLQEEKVFVFLHRQSESCDIELMEMKVDVRSLSGNLVNFKTKEQGRHTLITCGYALNSIITKCGVLFICSKVYQSRQIDRQ